MPRRSVTHATRARAPRDTRVRILAQSDIESLTDMRRAMRVIRAAFLAQAEGRVVMPPKVYLTLPDGDFRAMPAAITRPAIAGMKWVSVHPGNHRRGLPTVMGVLLINDPRTGQPLGILDGLSLTRLRTGAAAGVATQALARPGSHVVGLVGCGAQAGAQLAALEVACRLREVRVWGYFPGEARRFAARHAKRAAYRLVAVDTVKTCVEGADVIVTITASRAPLVQRAWLSPGVHINAMGADAPGKQELDPQILRDGRVIVDEIEQAVHGGELNVAISRGLVDARVIAATLGDVLIDRAQGRRSAEQITIFDSTGIAVHDVALGHAVLERARRAARGQRIRLFDPS